MPTSDFFFLLPTTLQYAKFEKVGIKNANLATLLPTTVYKIGDSPRLWDKMTIENFESKRQNDNPIHSH